MNIHQALELQASPANHLLAAMSATDRAMIAPEMVEVELVRGVDLVSPGQSIANCWFPVSGLISIIAVTAAGHQAEVGVIGTEGAADLVTLLGDDRSPHRALVQLPGRALRLQASVLQAAMQESPTLRAFLLAYAHAFSMQVAGTALANAQFTVEQRLARWLLMCADRVGPTKIALTHETLSVMLGVRRAGVTVALNHLEGLKAIVTRRVGIDVADRTVLLGVAGDAYGMPEAEYLRLLGKLPPAVSFHADFAE